MAKRKVVQSEGAETPVEKPVVNAAEVFARQRRVKCLSKAEGEQLIALLVKAGVPFAKRGNAELMAITPTQRQVVIDLTN